MAKKMLKKSRKPVSRAKTKSVKRSAKVVKRSKTIKAPKGKIVKRMLKQSDAQWEIDKKFERKMHDFLDAWRNHLREELRLHQELLQSKDKKKLDAHVKKAAVHHADFVKRLKQL